MGAQAAPVIETVIINNNPETVSTDFDTADRLYFEPLTPEDVMNVIETENPYGVVVAFGGGTAIKLTKFLESQGVRILGTSADSIDRAEDRERFDELLEELNIKRPKGAGVMTEEEAIAEAHRSGLPGAAASELRAGRPEHDHRLLRRGRARVHEDNPEP